MMKLWPTSSDCALQNHSARGFVTPTAQRGDGKRREMAGLRLCLVALGCAALAQGFVVRGPVGRSGLARVGAGLTRRGAGGGARARGVSVGFSDKQKEPEKEGLARLLDLLDKEAAKENDPTKKRSGPPIYEPGNYGIHVLAALAYAIPIVDASDLGKYMFEAYPQTAEVYNGIFGPASAIYNGVPFLPFAVFFLMSYICRAPTFPVEVRFHFAQAFMLGLIQFVPSLGLGLLEKAGVPGLGVVYNTVFLWVITSALFMQLSLLNPLSSTKNPVLVNIVGWALRYMNYTTDMKPK